MCQGYRWFTALIVLALSAALSAQPREVTTAFGLKAGMTLDEVQRAAGAKLERVPDQRGTYSVTKLPQGDPTAFDDYLFIIGSKSGLCKVVAIGADITTGSAGGTLRSRFDDVEERLSERFGAPTSQIDRLQTGSIWNEPEDFMMGLLKDERKLISMWSFGSGRGAVMMTAKAVNTNKGYVSIYYEFPNFDACQNELKVVL